MLSQLRVRVQGTELCIYISVPDIDEASLLEPLWNLFAELEASVEYRVDALDDGDKVTEGRAVRFVRLIRGFDELNPSSGLDEFA